MPETNVDVLIIGAGPAGLMCANALNNAGVEVRIVDKRPAGIEAGQADGIQPRTHEILQSYGLFERLLREGREIHRNAFYNPGRSGGIERVDRMAAISSPTARYPFTMTRHQGGTEALFRDAMKPKGLEVEQATVPTVLELSSSDPLDVKDTEAHLVKVVLQHFEGDESEREVVHAKFVVGTDGAHSWVRKAMGIQLEGAQTEFVWGVVDFVPETDFPDIRARTVIHSTHGSILVVPREGDLVRLYVQLSDVSVVDRQTNRVDKAQTSPEKLIETAAKILQPYRLKAIGEVQWWTVYIIGQRVAERFSVEDRILIAGDACHTHSPKAGQGMNASMGDTHNLAWKLAYVLKGWADMSLLRTYEGERRKFAQDLIEFDRKWATLFSGKPRTESNQDGVTHEATLGVFKTFGGFTSGIGIRYAPSIIVNDALQAAAAKLIVGERVIPHVFIHAADAKPVNIHDLLPADTRFKILVFVGDVKTETGAGQLRALAERMQEPSSFLRRFSHGDHSQIFDVLCFTAAERDSVDYTDVPEVFRSHWSKVLVDDVDVQGRIGGGGFMTYGIEPNQGAIVVVRPDGYIGTVAPLERVDYVDEYFAGFML
ncbi:FAD binding domain-containing protein [Earliella scabrosa]|nr:FAD binding domain-containing protein [Earliella scabrosa]